MPSYSLFRITLLLTYLCAFKGNIIDLPLWTWNCINDNCVPTKATSLSDLQYLTTCNIICSGLAFWPQPAGTVLVSKKHLNINSDSFVLKISSVPASVKKYLQSAFEIFKINIRLMEEDKSKSKLKAIVQIEIHESEQNDPRLHVYTDERYKLRIGTNDGSNFIFININANSFCGARHALETLSQLIWYDPYQRSLLIINSATIEDIPKFRYRGIMLDTASNYFPIRDIKRTIDAMAACKLNTFHWHITNSRTFPLYLNSIRIFAKHGTYGELPIYRPDDIRDVAKYAYLRGIRVILEVNLPIVTNIPHWQSQLDIYSETYCLKNTSDHKCLEYLKPNCTIMYELLDLYTEIINLTGSDIIHLGNNICNSCTNKSNQCSFIHNVLQRLNTGKKVPLTILWAPPCHEVEQLKIDLKEYVHNIVIDAYNTSKVKDFRGIRMVLSHENAWDFNDAYPTWFGDRKIMPYNSWQHVYEHRPWAPNAINVEGGEGVIWATCLSNKGLDTRIWPRAAALAERLWSDRAECATRTVQARLDVHRERLITRGIQMPPLWSNWCSQNPRVC